MNLLGFMLLELIAALVIFGILAAAAVQRYIISAKKAYHRDIDAAISELNLQESQIWSYEMKKQP